MADIYCRVCGEPWDAYGVRHREDMDEREARDFLAGRGCPCCKGKKPEDAANHEMDFLESLVDPVNTDEDPIELLQEVDP